MRPIPAAAAGQFGVFRTDQALRSGWTSHALRHATDRGRLDRIRPGVYARPVVATGVRHVDETARLRQAAAALSLVHRRVPTSHSGAAALYDLPLLSVPTLPCATFPRARRGTIPHAHLHRAGFGPGDVVRLRRILLLSPARTVVDLGRELGADAAVAAVDVALRRALASPEGLREALETCAGWPGVRHAARAIELADPRAESPLESVSRLRIADVRLPPPEPQVDILTAAGRFLGRADFYWDEFGVVGEADGLAKYVGNPLGAREEKVRQGAMEDAGLIFVRWGWPDLAEFDPVAARLRNAFLRGVRPDRAPRLWIARSGLALPARDGREGIAARR